MNNSLRHKLLMYKEKWVFYFELTHKKHVIHWKKISSAEQVPLIECNVYNKGLQELDLVECKEIKWSSSS